MMNEILRDLINEGKVTAFVDDILVGTKTEEEHNKIKEEILRRLEENNLYIKLEKCIWKVRKIGFLEVVIGPNGIEIEKEKVDRILSWPKPKNVKNVIILLANLQWKVAFDTHYTNGFLIRICSRTYYQSLEHTKVLCEIVSRWNWT